MPSLGLAVFVGATVLVTSFLSGIFGMAGGMILLGVLLALLPVAPAMVLFGVTQLASNGWRAWLWRSFIAWRLVGGYAIGSIAMFSVMKLIAFLPDKAMIFIGLGLMPFIVDRLPPVLQPDITRTFAPVLCGAVIMVLQLLAGAAGNVLDVFFQQSSLDRKTIVATKAATQVLAHLMRILYFGTFASLLSEQLPWWTYLGSILIALRRHFARGCGAAPDERYRLPKVEPSDHPHGQLELCGRRRLALGPLSADSRATTRAFWLPSRSKGFNS